MVASSLAQHRLPILSNTHSATSQLPTVAALQALWDEVAQKPLWAPPHFWKYLRLRWQMRLSLMRPEHVTIVAPTGKVNDCSECTDICCLGARSTVLLRLRDIAMLCDIQRTDLITHTKPIFSQTQLAHNPALARQTSSQSWQIFPVLRQNSFGACVALNNEGRCGLYPHWPLSCQRFPYFLDTDFKEVKYSQRCQSFWIHPKQEKQVDVMRVAAVAAYNERIKDAILLAYAPKRLEKLGLMSYLRLNSFGR